MAMSIIHLGQMFPYPPRDGSRGHHPVPTPPPPLFPLSVGAGSVDPELIAPYPEPDCPDGESLIAFRAVDG